MQVSVKKVKGLERQLTIQVPAEQFDQAVNTKLQSMSRRVKIAGFRPGKAPLKVVQQRYGEEVQQDVTSDLIQRSYSEAIRQEALQPAGYPKIDAKPKLSGQDFEFTATFEVYPDIELADMTKIKIKKPICEITDKDVDKILQDLRNQRAQWQTVERQAKDGDQVLIDYKGTVDGSAFEGGSAEQASIEIGSKRMIEGFEDQLLGSNAGEDRVLKVKFPKDYHQDDLAGKKAEFQVKVHRIEEKQLPELDEEFIKNFGVEEGNLEALLSQLRDHLHRELDQHTKTYLKKQVMDGILELQKEAVPMALTEQEAERMVQQYASQFGNNNMDLSKFPREPFYEEATRRVKLGLILSEIIKENSMKADAKKVREYIERVAESYQNPPEMVKHYYSNNELLQNVESVILEEEIVDWVVASAKVSDHKMDFNELVQENHGKRA